MHFFILPVKKHCATTKMIYAKVWLHNSRPDLPYLLVLGWLLGGEDPSLWIYFSAGNPSNPCYVKNPAWAPATTLRWFQPKRRLKDKKVVMQTCPWSEICWMWGAMVKHMCNHLQYIYMQIMTSWHPSYSLFDMPIVCCWGFKYIPFPTHMSMYKHNFSHLLLAGWTLGKLGPYPTNPKIDLLLLEYLKRTNPSCEVWTNPSCVKETSGSSQLQ